MRTCIRCGIEMRDGYMLNVFDRIGTNRVLLTSEINGRDIDMGKPNVSVCPRCGEISLWVRTDRFL